MSALSRRSLAVISGIGCSGRISGYINAYGFHGIHGRALPIAQGVKLANRELTVIASGGDGDGFAIGMGHTVHAIRRNLDITYIVMDNQIYGLTRDKLAAQRGRLQDQIDAGRLDRVDVVAAGDRLVRWRNVRRAIVLQRPEAADCT